jgi:hypothetical protein
MSIEIDTYQQLSGSGGNETQETNSATISPVAASAVDHLTASTSTSAAVSSSSSSSSSSEPEDSNSYDSVFPSLPAASNGATAINSCLNFSAMAESASKLSLASRRQHTTTVFQVPLAERKDVKFGGNHDTNKRCEEIATRHNVKVEMCSAKDQSLHIVISGQEEKVQEAKRQIVAELQTERDFKVNEAFFFLFLMKKKKLTRALPKKTHCQKIRVKVRP